MTPASSTPFMPGMMTSENTRSTANSFSERMASAALAVGARPRVGVAPPPHRISEILEQLGRELPDIVIVLDDENAIAASGGRGLAADRGHFRFVCRGGGLRQVDREGRALAEHTFHVDLPFG